MMSKSNLPVLLQGLLFLMSCGGAKEVDKVFGDKLLVDGVLHEIHVFGNDSTNSTGFFHHNRIEIKLNQDSEPYQIIDQLDSYSLLYDEGKIHGYVADYNFDGFHDFRLSSGESFYSIEPYHLWLFDAESKQFAYNSFMESAASVDLDADNKQLTMTHGRGDDYTTYTYEFRNGDYVSVMEVEELSDYQNGTTSLTTRELIGGEMKQTGYRKFLFTESGDQVELKKSGAITEYKELSIFLNMIDERVGIFNPILIQDGIYVRVHDSCYDPSFNIVKNPEADYEFESFDPEYYPILVWQDEGEENYSIQQINYRDYGQEFNMQVQYLFFKTEDQPNTLGDYTHGFRWSFDSEIGSWIIFQNLSAYGVNQEKLFMPRENWENQSESIQTCDDGYEDYEGGD